MTKARDLANAATALSAVTATELGYLDGVTSAIQTQIDGKIGQATAINPSTITAKGDLIVGTGAGTFVAQAVGTNGQLLSANSAQADGVEWVNPPASGGMTQLLTGSFSGGTTSIGTIPSGYKQVVIMMRDAVFTGGSGIRLRFNNNSSSIYQISVHNISSSSVQNSGPGATQMDLTQGSTLEATRANNLTITIPDYAEGRLKYGQIYGYMVRPGNSPIALNAVFHMNSGSAITSAQFIMDSGSFTSGTYIVYGVN